MAFWKWCPLIVQFIQSAQARTLQKVVNCSDLRIYQVDIQLVRFSNISTWRNSAVFIFQHEKFDYRLIAFQSLSTTGLSKEIIIRTVRWINAIKMIRNIGMTGHSTIARSLNCPETRYPLQSWRAFAIPSATVDRGHGNSEYQWSRTHRPRYGRAHAESGFPWEYGAVRQRILLNREFAPRLLTLIRRIRSPRQSQGRGAWPISGRRVYRYPKIIDNILVAWPFFRNWIIAVLIRTSEKM